jgi:hypothetical protein
MPYSEVEKLALRDSSDVMTMQCPLALNGRGPEKGHCQACDNNLRPPKPYPIRDYLGRVVVSDE